MFNKLIAVATIEADEAIASSDFHKIMGISPKKGANRGDSGQFLIISPRLILMSGYGHETFRHSYAILRVAAYTHA